MEVNADGIIATPVRALMPITPIPGPRRSRACGWRSLSVGDRWRVTRAE
jgi:hypothetical protein